VEEFNIWALILPGEQNVCPTQPQGGKEGRLRIAFVMLNIDDYNGIKVNNELIRKLSFDFYDILIYNL